MEIEFIANLEEATEDLGPDEILLCPVNLWGKVLDRNVGGLVTDFGIRRPGDDDFYYVRNHILGYNPGHLVNRDDFSYFFFTSVGSVLGEYRKLGREIRSQIPYIKEGVLKNFESIYKSGSFDYDLFVVDPYKRNNTTSIISSFSNSAPKKYLIEEEKKVDKYLPLINQIVSPTDLPSGVVFHILVQPTDYGEGEEPTLDPEFYYELPFSSKKKALVYSGGKYVILNKPTSSFVVLFRNIEYDKEKVYVILRTFTVIGGKRYLLGLPLIRARVNEKKAYFLSGNAEFSIREEKRSLVGKGSTQVEVAVLKDFSSGSATKATFPVFSLFYSLYPEGRGDGIGDKFISTTHFVVVNFYFSKTSLEGETSQHVVTSSISVERGGEVSISNIRSGSAYEVEIAPSDRLLSEYPNLSDLIDLLDNFIKDGRKFVYSGEINDVGSLGYAHTEVSFSKDDIKTFSMEGEIKYRFYLLFLELIKNFPHWFRKIREKVEEDNKNKRFKFLIGLEEGVEGVIELEETIERGLLLEKTMANMRYLNMVEELCFAPSEGGVGDRVYLKYPSMKNLDELGESVESFSTKLALERLGVDQNSLVGEEKSVEEILKLGIMNLPLLFFSYLDYMKEANRVVEKVRGVLNSRVPLDFLRIVSRPNLKNLYPKLPHYVPIPSGGLGLAFFDSDSGRTKIYLSKSGKGVGAVELVTVELGKLSINLYL